MLIHDLKIIDDLTVEGLKGDPVKALKLIQEFSRNRIYMATGGLDKQRREEFEKAKKERI